MPITSGAGMTSQSNDASLQTPGGGAAPSTLAGGDADATSAAAPESDEGMKQVVQQVRQMQMQMTDMARQFPAAASAFRAAMGGLRSALKQIIANPGAPEPPAPSIGG